MRLAADGRLSVQIVLPDMQLLAFIIQDGIQLLPLTMVYDEIAKDLITPETLYFNNTIRAKNVLLYKWIIRFKERWLSKKFLKMS